MRVGSCEFLKLYALRICVAPCLHCIAQILSVLEWPVWLVGGCVGCNATRQVRGLLVVWGPFSLTCWLLYDRPSHVEVGILVYRVIEFRGLRATCNVASSALFFVWVPSWPLGLILMHVPVLGMYLPAPNRTGPCGCFIRLPLE